MSASGRLPISSLVTHRPCPLYTRHDGRHEDEQRPDDGKVVRVLGLKQESGLSGDATDPIYVAIMVNLDGEDTHNDDRTGS